MVEVVGGKDTPGKYTCSLQCGFLVKSWNMEHRCTKTIPHLVAGAGQCLPRAGGERAEDPEYGASETERHEPRTVETTHMIYVLKNIRLFRQPVACSGNRSVRNHMQRVRSSSLVVGAFKDAIAIKPRRPQRAASAHIIQAVVAEGHRNGMIQALPYIVAEGHVRVSVRPF